MFTFYYQNIADKNTFQPFCSTRTNSKVVTLFARKVIAYFRFYYICFEITGDPCNLLALSDVIYSQITSFSLNHIFSKSRHSCFKIAPFLVWIPGAGGTRYILGWGGAARPLIPWPCLRQKSLIFLPCLRHLTRNHTLCQTIINIETLSHLSHGQSQNYLQLFKT